MSTKIRLVAVVGVVALAALALASMPAFANDNSPSPRLDPGPARGGDRILTLDRRHSNEWATPRPIVPPDKDPKPGRLAGAPAGDPTGGESGGFGSAIIGGGSASSSKTDRVERSLRATADKLR